MSDLLTPCKTCKKEVSKTAKTCPHCGQNNPAMTTEGCLKGIGIALVLVVVLSLLFGSDDDTQPTTETENTSGQQPSIYPSQNMQLVVDSLNTYYGIEATYTGDCLNARFCEVQANKVQIQSMGYTVSALASSKVLPSLYRQVCSGIFIGLTGGNQELAERAITQGFNTAAQNGEARFEVLGVNFSVKPSYNGLLECSFVKYP